MTFRITVAVGALALVGAVAANAQVQPPQERINAAFARARQAGIPVTLLESKMAEGKAKGVPLDRIAVAIERRGAALERANLALRGEADAAASLAVGADAIESGVSEAVLKAVAERSPRDRRNVAIAALTELVHQGNVPEAALERVREALRRGPDALANLPAEAAANGRGRSNGPPDGPNGNGRGRGHAEPGPPSAVPAPGDSPQSRNPEGPQGRGRDSGQGNGQGGSPDRSENPGRGRGR
jgi:hypothetical protein